jgi:hypothetical protein
VHPGCTAYYGKVAKRGRGSVTEFGMPTLRTMEMEKKKRGRPRKARDTIQFWQFARAAHVMCAYDEERERGEKHSAAIQCAMDSVKQRSPKMRMSRTDAHRILATCRPRGSQTILRFERSNMSEGDEEDIKRRRWILELLAMSQGKKGPTLPTPPNNDPAGNVAVFKFRFAERPNYPRHNRKNPNE